MEIEQQNSKYSISQKGSLKRNRKGGATDQNENKSLQNVWDAHETMLRGNFIALNAYSRN